MKYSIVATLLISALSGPAAAQFVPSAESLEGLYPGKTYSPYAKRPFPSRVFWGESHLHTALSPDAGLFGNTLGLDEAYRFARGEEVTSATGLPVRLARPLDWMAVADHSDMMGFAPDLFGGAPAIVDTEQGRRWFEGLQQGGEAASSAALDLITTFAQAKLDPKLLAAYSPGSSAYNAIWEDVIEAAERYNDPGVFTTFIAYEWTSLVKGNNLHRNVILRDGARRAEQVVPMVTQEPFGSTDPLDLYAWLETYEAKTGGRALAIAHNGNLSNGLMFPIDAQYTGAAVDENYVTLRDKWEPLYEVTQIKGDGETHPVLSPTDEFADFETWDAGNLDLSEAKTDAMLRTEYAREALKQGLALEEKLGTNPYKFGMVGSTDSHTSLATADEDNYFGKATSAEPSPKRMSHAFAESDKGVFPGWSLSASGYAGVWATENTREAIWDAMARKEVYATTGPRMMVRFFGGWDFTETDLRSRQPAFRGYGDGVPMGGDLKPAPDGAGAPTFMVYALRDPIGANLDRIQIVKGWHAADGTLNEKVYDVAWSDGREPGDDGKLPPVGNTVDLEAASWTNTIGAAELGTVWTDPEFDPSQRAFYYARVIEIPTPRWVVYDAVRFGVEIPEDATTTLQERAYTSPIWYTPAS
ncbi:DUF3604 domain-containing protein [Defluviimonas sp. WL0024]|uniref:DUF3604 domain-containing protein n=2 Tax=Albidovulum TaxID=205889 RepID=A0ABT3J457_9RHOB|nr:MULTISPECIES: DUF3604 domain-containing protein [Defluviimonas]MCU9847834.1 DUF3604 domain-containing protein [Defluviimonas sp. WL0024]MCW3782453.1 DUF3604 domain-containing protein [Defluviimonas salinarum]